MPKAIPGDVVVLNFDNEFGLSSAAGILPLTLIPSASAAGC